MIEVLSQVSSVITISSHDGGDANRAPELVPCLVQKHVSLTSSRRAGKAACSPFRCCSGAARRARRQALLGGERRIVQCVSSHPRVRLLPALQFSPLGGQSRLLAFSILLRCCAACPPPGS